MTRAEPRRRTTAAETRDRIVSAAAEVMAGRGLAGATTKEIARAAGCSEALLYKHFADKEALFLAVLQERFPPFVEWLGALADRTAAQDEGGHDVRAALVETVRRAVPFYRVGVPMLGSLFADPALLRRHRDGLAARGAGPAAVGRMLAGYLAGQRAAGRVPRSVDPDRAADLLAGACFQRGFLEAYGETGLAPLDDFAAGVVDGVLERR